MNLHFAGADGSDKYNQLLKDCGAKNRLESYWTLKKKEPSKEFHLLLDSGGFVARNKGIHISVEKYAEYLNKFNPNLAFELDTASKEETLSNRMYLKDNVKDTKIIPVYHYGEYEQKDKKYLFDMMDNYDYISVGGVAGRGLNEAEERQYLDFVFFHTQDKHKVHGLGITDTRHLKRYPFYSVDSTSWLSPGRFGNFKSVQDDDFAGFLAKKRHYLTNIEREVKYWLNIQKFMTELWIQKGVSWKD